MRMAAGAAWVRRGLTRILEGLLVVAMTVLILDVLWGVFSRYILGDQSGWTEELARALMIQVALFGSAAAFGERAHLGVDFVVERLHGDARRLAGALAGIVVAGFGGVLVSGGWKLVTRTRLMEQQLMALGIEKFYIYICVPLAGALIIFIGVEEAMRHACKKPGGMAQ